MDEPENQNKMIECIDCHQEFAFTEVDQVFFREHKFAEPKRCLTCRKARRAMRETHEPEPRPFGRFDTFER
jgi:NAD-dependent SIR2 family protein deacetylase